MLVSIITPLYNAEHYIEQTIQSVLMQSYLSWEMIITDDNSTDGSVDIVEKYILADSRIKLIKLKKQHGPAKARNVAIKMAKGRYIAFLDSDDTWVPKKLEKQLSFMQENNLAFSYSSYTLIDEQSKEIGVFRTRPEITYSSMLKTCSVGCLTAIYDIKKVKKTYMVAENLKKGEDYVLWLDIMRRIKTTKGIEEPLAKYRIHKNTLSSNKLNAAKAQWHVYRNFEKLNIFQSMYYLVNYAYYGFLKYR